MMKKMKESNVAYCMSVMIVANVFVFILKEMVEQERPDRSNKRAFPSFHTCRTAVSLMVMIVSIDHMIRSFHLSEERRRRALSSLGLVSLLLTGLIGLARMMARKHFLGDVIAGAYFGYTISCMLLKLFSMGHGLQDQIEGPVPTAREDTNRLGMALKGFFVSPVIVVSNPVGPAYASVLCLELVFSSIMIRASLKQGASAKEALQACWDSMLFSSFFRARSGEESYFFQRLSMLSVIQLLAGIVFNVRCAPFTMCLGPEFDPWPGDQESRGGVIEALGDGISLCVNGFIVSSVILSLVADAVAYHQNNRDAERGGDEETKLAVVELPFYTQAVHTDAVLTQHHVSDGESKSEGFSVQVMR